MIEMNRRPVGADVTVLADIGRLDVVRRLAGCRRAVMAGRAGP